MTRLSDDEIDRWLSGSISSGTETDEADIDEIIDSLSSTLETA
jgi:hypothetical protein